MRVYPPGTILQRMFLKKKLQSCSEILEIGCGNGTFTDVLLTKGNVTALDLDIKDLTLEADNLKKVEANFLSFKGRKKYDLIFSALVLEHLNNEDAEAFVKKCHKLLKPSGQLVLLVPGNPGAWGIEDEIAGHYRRYTPAMLRELGVSLGMKVDSVRGLTYPVSNWLLPISNLLVTLQESDYAGKEKLAQTVASGRRTSWFKAKFPDLLKYILNEKVLYPLYLLQEFHYCHAESLILCGSFKK